MKRKVKQHCFCVVCRRLCTEDGVQSPYGTHICMDCADCIYEFWGKFHQKHLDHCQHYENRRQRITIAEDGD